LAAPEPSQIKPERAVDAMPERRGRCRTRECARHRARTIRRTDVTAPADCNPWLLLCPRKKGSWKGRCVTSLPMRGNVMYANA